MNPPAKLAAFVVVLALVFGVGSAIGSAVGPIDVDEPEHGDEHDGHDESGASTGAVLAGLAVSQDGYTFVPEDRLADQGRFAFAIEGPDGEPVRQYDELHDRELHLVLASDDLQEYAHVHPTRGDGGTWTVDLPALAPGAYRAFADFQPAGGQQLTLGVDLTAPGTTTDPAPLEPVHTDEVDGFDVTLDESLADGDDEVTVTVRQDGEVVTTEPYLGAAGHLVALRDGDLAYLHVHPLDEQPGGPVRFAVEVPTPGAYALFFDFQVDGEVHTARFVVDTAAGGGEPSPVPAEPATSTTEVEDHAHEPGEEH